MLEFTEEQKMLQESADRFVKEHYEFNARRKKAEAKNGFDPELWRMMAELGWLMLPFSEADGGIGGGLVDQVGLFEAFGRGLVLEPYFAVVSLGGGLAQHVGSADRRAEIIGGIMGGERFASAGLMEPRHRFDLYSGSTTATEVGSGRYRLDGLKSLALGGGYANDLFILARTAANQTGQEGWSLFVVDANASGVQRKSYRLRDDHAACDIKLDGVEVGADALVGELHKASEVLDQVFDAARVSLAAEALGIMAASLDQTQEYAGTRQQFGRPIGSFQVLTHRLTDMFVDVEQTRSLIYRAALDADKRLSGRRQSAMHAHLKAITGGLDTTKHAIQVHGGMGVTEELAIGHHYRRMMTLGVLLGDAHTLRRQYADAAA